MDRNMQPRSRTVTVAIAAVVALVLSVLLVFVVPEATRGSTVANYGIQTADMVGVILRIAGFLFAAGGGTAAYFAGKWILNERREAEAKRKRERPIELPPRNETDLEKIIPLLRQVAHRYPDTADEIEQVLAHQASFGDSLRAIDKIFKANPGIITDGDAEFNFASYEFLLQRVIKGTCSDLVSIIYQAEATQNFSIARLEQFIDQVNRTNVARIEMANELAFKAAESVPKVDQSSDHNVYAPEHLRQLLVRLSETQTTLRKEIL